MRQQHLSSQRTDTASTKWRLVVSISVALASLHHSAGNVFPSMPQEDEPANLSSLSTSMSDVILVSFGKPWNEAHASFARLFGAPLTTWRVPNTALKFYAQRSITRGKTPVLVAADPSENLETISTKLRGAVGYTCWPWVFIRHHSEHQTYVTGSWKPFGYCDVVAVLGVNETRIQSIFWPKVRSTDFSPRSKEMLRNLGLLQHSSVKSLSGQQLRVVCVKDLGTSGNHEMVMRIFHFLRARNVTVKRVYVPRQVRLLIGLYHNLWDIVFVMGKVQPSLVFNFDFPVIVMSRDTFYSGMGAHRVVAPSEVVGESWKLVATTVLLLAFVAVVSAAVGKKGWSAFRGICDTSMFLLAAVLATSAVVPNVVGRGSVIRKALLGLWLVVILTLSVYFRTELTSVITVKRPAYRIDTLQKLEDALDRSEVAPCVVRDTTNHGELNEKTGTVPRRSLINKLRFAFEQHSDQGLVTDSASACLQCATRRDRVCYKAFEYRPNTLLGNPPNVRAFVEHMKLNPCGFPMLKYQALYRPLRRFFLSIQEQKLINPDVADYDYGDAETKFDVSSLFIQLIILHAASCLVLLLEIIVARCLRRV